MKARISQATLKRLEQLERPRVAAKRGGLLVVPKIMDLDEWQKLAAPMQAKLLEDVKR